MGNWRLVLDRIAGRLANHVAGCFEEVCREAIAADTAGWGCVRVGRQWGAHYEIDIAGVDDRGCLALVGQCKWSTQKVGLSVLEDLRRTVAANALPVSPECRHLLCSRAGFSEELVRLGKNDPRLALRTVPQP